VNGGTGPIVLEYSQPGQINALSARVVSLLAADHCGGPLPSYLPDVNQTVIASQISVSKRSPCFAPLRTHLSPTVSGSLFLIMSYRAWDGGQWGTRHICISRTPPPA